MPEIPPEQSLIEYPSAFPIKVMGAHVEGFVDAVVAVAIQFDPGFDRATVETRPSKAGTRSARPSVGRRPRTPNSTFWRTVRCGKSAPSWKTYPVWRSCGSRNRFDAESNQVSPPNRTTPRSGRSSPATLRRTVVLPEPDGPNRTRMSPAPMATSRRVVGVIDPPPVRASAAPVPKPRWVMSVSSSAK